LAAGYPPGFLGNSTTGSNTEQEVVMASIFDRVRSLARNPQGKRLMENAQRMARDPRTRQRITEMRGRLKRRG
jgi:hypothetical protein